MMSYRRLGRTGLRVSAIGFGTCQLRMVPYNRALETLITGFNMGVNIVHTAPDYAGAVEIVEEAIRISRKDVYVCSNGWGSIEYFEHLFEQTRDKFGKIGKSGVKQLDLFGIACPEDRDILGEDAWGPDGMVAFLAAKKREGKLVNTFCTCHGSPKYIRGLIESGAFDAVMLAYNPLGYHMLSWNPPDARGRECVSENKQLFAIAAEHDVGIMLMEVLGGGLLCRGKAFPSRTPHLDDTAPLPTAGDILRYLLQTEPTVACLLPGTASVEEAAENAMAGHKLPGGADNAHRRIRDAVDHLKTTVCCRCGQCEQLCSHDLPISWLFRAAQIARADSVPFETPRERQYFDLHSTDEHATCATCQDITCGCPHGIDIPTQLIKAHLQMCTLLARGEVPGPTPVLEGSNPTAYSARLVSASWNGSFATVVIENVGTHAWHLEPGHPIVEVHLRDHRDILGSCQIRAAVGPAAFGYFVFDVQEPLSPNGCTIWILFRDAEAQGVTELQLGNLQTARD
ncbi:MAG: aldo/keto reductase [Xanthobacteraceae bacterium]